MKWSDTPQEGDTGEVQKKQLLHSQIPERQSHYLPVGDSIGGELREWACIPLGEGHKQKT